MKSKLLLFLMWLITWGTMAQAPVIAGDEMLCPDGEGTAYVTGNTVYDSYQWYFKPMFGGGDYQAIAGATGDTFTYDAYNYAVHYIKVVVTLDGVSYDSNALAIDSLNWLPIVTSFDDPDGNLTYDPGQGYLLCLGGTVSMSVNMPYEIVTWYRDDEVIEGETGTSLTITESGTYIAAAAPAFCPESISYSLPITVTVIDCSGTGDPGDPGDPGVGAPVIAGDELLCPNTYGTASVVTEAIYDSYQWYYKYWFLDEEDFVAINGATEATFTYDWYTYDQALIKVVVTLQGVTYESNVLQIDSYNWTSLLLSYDLGENVTFDPVTETFFLCDGTTFDISVNNPPYDVVSWYKDGVLIEGANESTYTITEPGVYQAEAAPSFCPDSTTMSVEMIVVGKDCNLGTNVPQENLVVTYYPNPVQDELHINISNTADPVTYVITDITGKTVKSGNLPGANNTIALNSLTLGVYFVKITSGFYTEVVKVIKN